MEKTEQVAGEAAFAESVRKAPKKNSEQELRKQWEEDSKLVKGVFRCHEPRGGEVNFIYRQYKWDQPKRYHLKDGEEYTIPLGVAKHLNQNCNYYEHTNILGPDGSPLVNRQGKRVSRMNFESLDFWRG